MIHSGFAKLADNLLCDVCNAISQSFRSLRNSSHDFAIHDFAFSFTLVRIREIRLVLNLDRLRGAKRRFEGRINGRAKFERCLD